MLCSQSTEVAVMVAFTAAPATLGECQRAHPSLCPWHRMGMELSKHKVYDWVPTKKIFAQELQLFLLFQLFYLKSLIIFLKVAVLYLLQRQHTSTVRMQCLRGHTLC